MSKDVYFTPVYDKWTQKQGILIDSAFLDQMKLKLYEQQKTDLPALNLIDWLQKCVDQAEANRNKR